MTAVKKIFQDEMNAVQQMIVTMDWKDPEFYAEWLAQTYFFVCHSTRIIASAGVRFPIERNNLHNRFLQHASEEKNHEILAVKDLKHLGRDIKDFHSMPATQAFYQTQYFWIDQVNPASVYGYFLVLECLAIHCGPTLMQKLKPHHSEKSLNFLRIHVEEDEDHIEEHNEVLDTFNEEETKLIVENLKVSAYMYIQILKSVEEKVRAKKIGAPKVS